MSDIAKVINESISRVINEGAADENKDIITAIKDLNLGGKLKKAWAQTQDDMSRGRAAEIVYDKLHPEKIDDKFELAKKLAKARSEADKLRAENEKMGVGEHLTKAGKKALAAIRSKAEEAKENISDHPGLAAATAAGLAAAVGGLAAVKKMRKAAKK